MERITKILVSLILILSICLCLPFASMAAESDLTAQYLLKNITDPTCDAVGGEWSVVGLAGCSYAVPETYFDKYYQNLSSIVKERKGVLSEESYTEYSRAVIALSAINKSALDVAGYNLAEPLKDYAKVTEQGINGAIYALRALDSGGYVGPRKELREFILNNELPGGGWSYFGKGEADIDITAMAVQALSRYKYYPEVAIAIERAMPLLMQNQYDSSETVSQVIMAMDSLDIEPDDEIKKQLLRYRLNDGSFKHSLDDDEGNLMSTEQAFLALILMNAEG